MRILFFNYEYPPLGGGAGNASYYLLKEYAKIPDLKVDFITSSIDKKYHLENISPAIRIHRLPIGKNAKNMHFQSQKDLIVYSAKAYFFARKLIKKNRYDLSHSFFTVPCGFISLLLKWEFRLPYIVSLRGSDVPGYSERFKMLYGLLRPVVRLVWKRATHVVANSEGLKALALKTDERQEISVIYNGVNIDEFRLDFQQRREDDFTILCVSRVTPRKGIRYLIEAVAPLIEKRSSLRLLVIGEGDEKSELEKLVRTLDIEKNVFFLGLVGHSDLPQYYSSSDVFVLPSLNEGMSNTMLEALASGLPIIATDTGGTKELVRDGENGFIIKMKDSQDIAEKIRRIMSDKELAEKMSHKSRERAEQMSWGSVAREYSRLYKEQS